MGGINISILSNYDPANVAITGGSIAGVSIDANIFKLNQNVETLAANKTLVVTDFCIQKLDPDGADRDITLSAEALSTDLVFWIHNTSNGAGEDLVIKSDAPATLITLGPGMSGMFSCDGTIWLCLSNTGIYYDSVNSNLELGGRRVTFPGGTDDDGIVFGSLGTATKGIDFSSSGLDGASDYLFYLGAGVSMNADGGLTWGTTSTGYGRTSFDLLGGYKFGYIRGLLGGIQIRPAADFNSVVHLGNDNSSQLIGNGILIGGWAADGVSNGTTTITDVGGAAHGLNLAAGDMVHISNSTTAADEGFYRIVSDDGTNVVLDRALTGSNTNLSVGFYKDVIGFFATDNTNGQRIMGYSHQDKPLQIGGDILAATSHGLSSKGVLIGEKLEVDGDVYFDQTVYFYDPVDIIVNNVFGYAGYFEMFPSSVRDQITIGVHDGIGNQIIICDIDNEPEAKDYDHAIQTNPTLFIHSATDPDTLNTEWISFTHNQTDAIIGTGKGVLRTGEGRAYTPDAITATSETVAASIATVPTEITTNGDSDLDDVSLANGVDGQIKIFSVVAVGNAADSVKITPASMIGGTQITFAANPLGLGCIMYYDSGAAGWLVVGNNGGTVA